MAKQLSNQKKEKSNIKPGEPKDKKCRTEKRKMSSDQKPLYTLTIEEFITLTKKLIEDVINGNNLGNDPSKKEAAPNEEVFSILELSKFLRCSKVSIHNYKKKGMPFYKIGRKLLFKKAEILNFMKTLKHKRVITA